MKRKAIIAGAAAFASIGIIKAPAKAAQFELKMGTDNPTGHPLNIRAKQMCDAITAESGGKINMGFFPNNMLGGDTAMLTQLRSGALQMMTLDPGILQSVVPASAISSIGFTFKSDEQAFAALDGALGDYVRKEIAARGLYCFKNIWENGTREITSSTHPIKTADDLEGFKIRTPEAKQWVQLFKALGAIPTAMNFNEVYTSLQTHVVDGQENPLAIIETGRLYEVQKYLSITNHLWGGFWLLMNGDVWKSLPTDLQGVIERNAAKYALLDRSDTLALNRSLQGKLVEQGMVVNVADTATFQRKLGAFYASAKAEFGPTAWALLEQTCGTKFG
ncbi:MAG TPA: TRAP transporter substrate-binding protein [Candidatus Baltobacteraceae bacterium]|nr:TRAP transporter substrate-binding protein [Candidatus Baltobacteraceae bacterium]